MKSMKLNRGVPVMVLGLLMSLSASIAHAQVTEGKLEFARTKLQVPLGFFNKMPQQLQKTLSGSALNFFHVSNVFPELENQALRAQSLPPSLPPGGIEIPTPLTPMQVSNPAKDFVFGPASGFTQSETSTAWCGSNVVVGFNDSESYWASGFDTFFSSLSLNGFALSTNQGLSYTDMGYLPATTGNSFNFLQGDPVVACSSASTFYYASLFFTAIGSDSFTAISVSKSTNGGTSFGVPVSAVAKNAVTHFLDKDWMAVNPGNPNQIAVTYTDFDGSFTTCSSSFRTAIELVASFNGGVTWTAPQVIFEVCNVFPNFPSVQGSQVAFSPSGAVNVAFELSALGTPTGRQIEFAQAPKLGAFFGATVAVANVTPVGDGSAIQGGIRASLDLQGMAIDRSGLSTNGNIYIVYHDATKFAKSFSGVAYGYADAIITRSSNNGATWSPPVQVNTNTEPLVSGLGTDSYMPGVAVDNTSGKIAVCWYDRRNDPLNYMVDRYCGESVNAGATFTNTRITPSSFTPIHGADDLINPTYFGDYDTVASDSLKTTSGFIGAFQVVRPVGGSTLVPNSDVQAQNFK